MPIILDKEQQKFVDYVFLRHGKGVHIQEHWQAGSGKTTCLVELIRLLLRYRKNEIIWVCCCTVRMIHRWETILRGTIITGTNQVWIRTPDLAMRSNKRPTICIVDDYGLTKCLDELKNYMSGNTCIMLERAMPRHGYLAYTDYFSLENVNKRRTISWSDIIHSYLGDIRFRMK